MMNGEGMGLGFIMWFVILAMIIAGAVWFARSQPLAGSQRGSLEQRFPALEALEERYARGEISREEYLQKKRDITD
jgi:putative membrane protein